MSRNLDKLMGCPKCKSKAYFWQEEVTDECGGYQFISCTDDGCGFSIGKAKHSPVDLEKEWNGYAR